jgi:hypothetical protein
MLNPQSLLEIIDKDVQVKFSNFKETRRVLTHKYKQIRQKISEINEQISQKDKRKSAQETKRKSPHRLPANLRFHQSPMKSIVHQPTNLSDNDYPLFDKQVIIHFHQ